MRSALAGPKVFPQMKGFICASWGVFDGVEGKGRTGVIKDPDVKQLFDQMAASEFKGFVNPDQPGVMNGSNASLVAMNAQGKIVHVFNDVHAFEKEFKAAWEKLHLSPSQFPEKTAFTFPGVKETAASKGPGAGPAGGDYAYLVKNSGPAFRLFIDPGSAIKLVVEARPIQPAQKEAISWSSQPKEIEAAVFKSLLDTINPGGVARAADVVIPWKEIKGALKYQPSGQDDNFRYAVISGPILMTKKEGTFRAEGTFHAVVSYPVGSSEINAVRGAINAKYVGGGNATPDRPTQFAIALVTTPEPKEIPEAFVIPFGKEK